MKTTNFIVSSLFLLLFFQCFSQYDNTFEGSIAGGNGRLNVYIGFDTGQNISNATDVSGNRIVFGNVCLGVRAGKDITYGQGNTFLGYQSGVSTTGSNTNDDAQYNTFLGFSSGTANTFGEYNTYCGVNSGGSNQTGQKNTFIGQNAGQSTTGSYNVILGSAIGNSSLNSNIVLSDGSGITRMIFRNNGWAGIQLVGYNMPNNALEIGTAFAVTGTAGLRFRNYENDLITPITNPDADKGVLSVNGDGDVIFVKDESGAINSCTTVGRIPKVTDTSGNLGCSSIHDDGNGYVGFGFSGASPGPQNVMVNGSFATLGGPYVTSDRNFKRDIRPITNALTSIQNLEGKTYFWKTDEYKERNFTTEKQYGLIAQDVEKIFPEMIMKSKTGDYSLNYTELIPVLIEAIKEQQLQLEELKTQISDNFKSKNADLINLGNTKIISISPNPSNGIISISFNVDKSVSNAKLLVHDLNGNVLSSLTINDRENNITRTLQKDNFGSGIYIISLVVNGKSIDTKKFIFN